MNKKNNSLGVYIHIPFCVKKCNYCDFLSFSASGSEQEKYMDALCNEIRRFCNGKSYMADSVFIGGGTPSVLNSKLIEKLMETVNDCFKIHGEDGSCEIDCNFVEKSGAEITIEVNPGTMTEEKAEVYKKCGINRISVGLQSTKDCLLERIGRIHKSREFYETFSLLRNAGFNNINTDIMFALPGQSFSDWKETVDEVIKLKPEHISFYSLIIEEGTPFFDDLKKGRIVRTDDDTDRAMYHYAVEALREASYNHYEISNAALPGRESMHNLKYWNMKDYIGFGLGAHSFINRSRFCNTDHFEKYLELYSSDNSGNYETCDDVPSSYELINVNSRKEDMEEMIFTGLRKIEGISKKHFREYCGVDIYEIYASQIERMIDEDMLEEVGDMLRLTKKGLDFANYVMREFIGD